MKLKKYFLIVIITLITQNFQAQIKNLDDVIIKTEELRMITQRMAKNYIMRGIMPNNPKIKKEMDDDAVLFTDTLLQLTDDALNEEIEIELQKLNLSWMLLNRIIQKKYDAAAAAKVINYADKMEKEIDAIADMVNQTTKLKSVKLLRISSNGRMLSQKLLLYYIAGKAKIRNKDIPQQFENTKAELYEVIKLLTDQSENDPDLKSDEGVLMYVEMIKDGFDKVRKNITLKSKVHPKTANMIVNQMTDNFDLLTNILYEKFN
jgi:hypothetical protein